MEAIAAAGTFLKTYSGYIALAGAGIGAYSAQQQGQMQSLSARLQAGQASLQGKQNALNYNRQAVQVLRRQEQLAATVRARAASGGIDPFSGSPLTIEQVDMMRAQEEAEIARQNAQMAVYGGLAQSQSLQAAASQYSSIGVLNAVSTAVRGVGMYADLATPGSTRQAPDPVRDAVPVAVG